MAASTQLVRFTKDSTNTDNATQDVSLNFTPIAVIVFSEGNTANNTASAHYQWSQGFSDGTNQCCACITSDDADAAADTQYVYSNNSVYIRMLETNNGTVEERATIAFGSNKVTFTWVVNSADATRITLWAIGGADVTTAKVNTVTINRSGTGTQNYTGLGFTPDDDHSVIFTLGVPNITSASNSSSTTAGSWIGCGSSTTKRWCVANTLEDTADPTDTWRVTVTDKIIHGLSRSDGTLVMSADFEGWITDGFTLDWTTNPGSTALFSYLVIRGGTWDVGTLTSPTSATNNVDYSVSVGSNTLRGLFMAAAADATSGSIDVHGIISIGATDGTNQGVIGEIDLDAFATTDSFRITNGTQIVKIIIGSGADSDVANFDSFPDTSHFRLDWTTKSVTAQLNPWAVIADGTASVQFDVPISESSITVGGGTLERVLTANRTLSESSISVSETVARMLTANRTLSESSISVSDTVDRVKTQIRTINESSISVSDDVARLRTVPVAINESAISVSDDLARMLTANRSIDEDVDVSDTGEGNKIAITTITEDAISVNDTLARMLTANRSIDEDVDVSETLARMLTANRSISESGIDVSDTIDRLKILVREILEDVDVSDTLARLLTANRSISESSISVSDTVDRIKTQIRSISESSISVSDTVAAIITLVTRTISEAAISVSDTLARQLTAFRTIAEDAISVSDTGSDGVLFFPTLAEFITDLAYTNPVRFRITWKSKKGDTTADESGDQIIYYQYDSWNFQERPFNITNFSIRLTQGEISSASCTIEDHNELIDDPNKIGKKSVVEVDFKKELGRDWERILTGYVRSVKTLRPAYRALGYQITIKSKQIIYNERIVDFKRAAARSSVDSTTAVVTDSRMLANNLFRELHTATDIFPRRNSPTLQQTGDFDLDTGTISEEVVDFITEIAPGLTTAAEVANQLTEGIGAIWGVDVYGNPYLRYPSEKHSGIIITDSPSTTDSAVNISVNMASFEFESTIDTSEGNANCLYVLNSKDTKVQASSNKASGSTTLTTRWIAQSFIATEPNITGAAFILSKTGNPTNDFGTIRGRLRAEGDPGIPNGTTLATFEISFSQLSTSKDTIFVNDIKTKPGVITIGQRYWWVLQGDDLFDNTNTVNWHHDNDLVTSGRPPSAILPLVDIDPTQPGDQIFWSSSDHRPVYAFSTFSSINHIVLQRDSESIDENGLIEAIVNLPAFNTDADYQKVLVKLLRDSAKEKRIFDLTKITIPTGRLFRPGELVTIIDSKANLDREKQINAEIVEVTYNFDVNNNALGCKYVDLRAVGFIDSVTDDYLENREC